MNAAIKSGDDGLFESLMKENCPVDVEDEIGWRPLHVAAHNSRLSMVQRLLQHEDIVIDRVTSSGKTALRLAIDQAWTKAQGPLQVCKCLLENGAQTNIADVIKDSPLHIATRTRLLDCARLLVEFGANVNVVNLNGFTPIFEAALEGDSDMVALLIESGANVNVQDNRGFTPLFVSAANGHLQCLRLIHQKLCDDGNANVDVEDDDGQTPLIIATRHGWWDCVRFLLDKGADADHAAKDNALAIHLAIWKGDLGCVKALLPRTSQYALLRACYGSRVTKDPDWLPAFLDQVKGNCALDLPVAGFSILHLAVELEKLEILRYLLESGIHPDHYIKVSRKEILNATYPYVGLFQTALGLACHKGSEKLATVLLDHGAQFTLGNDLICNPLHYALTANCSTGFIRYSVERGADINGHTMNVNFVSPVMRYAFKNPHRLHELLVLGGGLKSWDPQVRGGVGQILVQMAMVVCVGDVLMEGLSILVHFAPRHRFKPLYSTVKSICEAGLTMFPLRWTKCWLRRKVCVNFAGSRREK